MSVQVLVEWVSKCSWNHCPGVAGMSVQVLSEYAGCQSDHQRIHNLAKSIDPKVDVKQATRVPNRFEISISQ